MFNLNIQLIKYAIYDFILVDVKTRHWQNEQIRWSSDGTLEKRSNVVVDSSIS